MVNATIQDKWNQGLLVGYDCIAFGDGNIVMADTFMAEAPETKKAERLWLPLCDTTLRSLQKYNDDPWTATSVSNGPVLYREQTIVFGAGAMGNEGFVASLAQDNQLDWSIFFTFSNPINKAVVTDSMLICYGDSGTTIRIDLNELTSIEIDTIEY